MLAAEIDPLCDAEQCAAAELEAGDLRHHMSRHEGRRYSEEQQGDRPGADDGERPVHGVAGMQAWCPQMGSRQR